MLLSPFPVSKSEPKAEHTLFTQQIFTNHHFFFVCLFFYKQSFYTPDINLANYRSEKICVHFSPWRHSPQSTYANDHQLLSALNKVRTWVTSAKTQEDKKEPSWPSCGENHGKHKIILYGKNILIIILLLLWLQWPFHLFLGLLLLHTDSRLKHWLCVGIWIFWLAWWHKSDWIKLIKCSYVLFAFDCISWKTFFGFGKCEKRLVTLKINSHISVTKVNFQPCG